MFFGGSPFEHFGGMPGADRGGGGRRGPPPDVDTTELYQILGIEKDASENDIKKAYRKLALKVRGTALVLAYRTPLLPVHIHQLSAASSPSRPVIECWPR